MLWAGEDTMSATPPTKAYWTIDQLKLMHENGIEILLWSPVTGSWTEYSNYTFDCKPNQYKPKEDQIFKGGLAKKFFDAKIDLLFRSGGNFQLWIKQSPIDDPPSEGDPFEYTINPEPPPPTETTPPLTIPPNFNPEALLKDEYDCMIKIRVLDRISDKYQKRLGADIYYKYEGIVRRLRIQSQWLELALSMAGKAKLKRRFLELCFETLSLHKEYGREYNQLPRKVLVTLDLTGIK